MNTNETDILKFFKANEITHKETPDNRQFIIACPVCGKEDHCYVNKETYADGSGKEHPAGMWDCKAGSCQANGNWWQLRKNYMQAEKKNKVNPVSDQLVKYYKSRLSSYPKYIEYLHGRGYSDSTIDHFDIGVDDQGRITLPVKREGKYVGVQKKNMNYDNEMLEYLRKKDTGTLATNEKAPAPWVWYGEPWIFNDDVIAEVLQREKDQNKPSEVLVHEGAWDVIASYEYGLRFVIGVPGANNKGKLGQVSWVDELKDIKKFYVCYDNDSAGQHGAKELASRLGANRCRNVKLPFNDMNKCFKEGVPYEEILALMDAGEEFETTGMYSAEYFEEEIVDEFFNHGKMRGYSSGYTKFDALTRGFSPAQIQRIRCTGQYAGRQ